MNKKQKDKNRLPEWFKFRKIIVKGEKYWLECFNNQEPKTLEINRYGVYRAKLKEPKWNCRDGYTYMRPPDQIKPYFVSVETNKRSKAKNYFNTIDIVRSVFPDKDPPETEGRVNGYNASPTIILLKIKGKSMKIIESISGQYSTSWLLDPRFQDKRVFHFKGKDFTWERFDENKERNKVKRIEKSYDSDDSNAADPEGDFWRNWKNGTEDHIGF